MKLLFWLLIASGIYCYFGYPVLLFILAKFFPRKIQKAPIFPTVSIILSVWNEQDVIEGKLRNLSNLNYPKEKTEILIGSDASDDRTNAIIQGYPDPRLRLFVNPVRQGKMATLNNLVQNARHEILIFTDARQLLDANAITELTANFSDPYVGCVSGELVLSEGKTAASRGINLYWNYEKFIRRQESRFHSMLGATGAIYAMRRKLFMSGPDDMVLDDMYFPFRVIRQGYRAVFDDRAKAFDEVAQTPLEEHRRKVRTLYGNYQIFRRMPEMFNPWVSPIAWQLFSHKFLRLMMPFVLIGIFILNTAFLSISLYRIVFILQCVFYAMAILGCLVNRREGRYGLSSLGRLCSIPQMFCLLNFSAVSGLVRYTFTGQKVTWEKARHI